MIPQFATAGVLLAPPSALLTTGYVPGNTLGAQHVNWLLYHLTAELNNVLSAQGLSQLTSDDSQVLKAVGRTNVLISTSGSVTTAAQFSGNTLVQFANLSGSSNYVIGNGAARPGVELIVEALTGSGVMIVNGSGSAFLGSGAVRLLWDGSQWCKIGGNAFLQVFTSGSAITWVTPWGGSYDCRVVGGGGGGGSASATAGSETTGGSGGGGGGEAESVLLEKAGAALVCTVGGGGSVAGAGNQSVLSDGTSTLTGGGGGAGNSSTNLVQGAAAAGGTATGGQLNKNGGPGGTGQYNAGGIGAFGAIGGNSPSFGGGGVSGAINTTGGNGSHYGGGGAGGSSNSASVVNGGTGAAGVIVIEF